MKTRWTQTWGRPPRSAVATGSGRAQGLSLPWSLWRERDFGLLASRTGRISFCCLEPSCLGAHCSSRCSSHGNRLHGGVWAGQPSLRHSRPLLPQGLCTGGNLCLRLSAQICVARSVVSLRASCKRPSFSITLCKMSASPSPRPSFYFPAWYLPPASIPACLSWGRRGCPPAQPLHGVGQCLAWKLVLSTLVLGELN